MVRILVWVIAPAGFVPIPPEVVMPEGADAVIRIVPVDAAPMG